MRTTKALFPDFPTAPLKSHKSKRTTAPEEVQFPRKAKNGLFDKKASRVCSRSLFFLIMELRGLIHVTSMCPELQCCYKWGQPPGTGSNSRQRLRTSTALCTLTVYYMHTGVKRHTRSRRHTYWLFPVEMKWCKMTSVAPVFCTWLITPADKDSTLSLLGVSKQARLSPHTSIDLLRDVWRRMVSAQDMNVLWERQQRWGRRCIFQWGVNRFGRWSVQECVWVAAWWVSFASHKQIESAVYDFRNCLTNQPG